MKADFKITTHDEGQILHSMKKDYKKWLSREQIFEHCRTNEADFLPVMKDLINEKAVRFKKRKNQYKMTHRGRKAVGIYSRWDNFRDWVERNKTILWILVLIISAMPLGKFIEFLWSILFP